LLSGYAKCLRWKAGGCGL